MYQWSLNALTCWAIWKAGAKGRRASIYSRGGCWSRTSRVKESWRQSQRALWREEQCASLGGGWQPGLGTSLQEFLDAVWVPASKEAEVSSGGSVSDWILRNAFPLNCGVHRTWRTSEQTPGVDNKLYFLMVQITEKFFWERQEFNNGNQKTAGSWELRTTGYNRLGLGSKRQRVQQTLFGSTPRHLLWELWCETVKTLMWAGRNYLFPCSSQWPVIFTEDYYW